MEKIFVRSAYNYDREKVSNETGLACMDESKTQQHQKDDADINVIVKRFGLTGELPNNIKIPQYGDFTGIGTYHEAYNAVIAAQDEFMKLPASIRSRFQNDAEQFVEFCSDPKNSEELIKMGLAVRRERVAESKAMPETKSPASQAEGAAGEGAKAPS